MRGECANALDPHACVSREFSSRGVLSSKVNRARPPLEAKRTCRRLWRTPSGRDTRGWVPPFFELCAEDCRSAEQQVLRLRIGPASVRESQPVASWIRDLPGRNQSPVLLFPASRQADPTREEPLRQDPLHAPATGAHPCPHRGCRSRMSLREPFEIVPPHQEHPQPRRRTVAALRERDRLPLVIGTAVADQQVQEVDREQRVTARPRRTRRDRSVDDMQVGHAGDRPRVVLELVSMELEGLR